MAEFWETKQLKDMTDAEWESLCDGCARCCLHKLEDEDSGEVFYTSIVCRYLDQDTCRCNHYPQRHELVPNCVSLDAGRVAEFSWLPSSCAYRTLSEGRPLAWWHPLVSGDPATVRAAGLSVHGRVTDEQYVHEDDAESHIIRWVEL